jgi:antitoxin component of MazEF toxin-antitoxin module
MPRESDRPKLTRWGDGLGLLLPREAVAKLNMVKGTIVDINVVDGALMIRPAPTFKDKLAAMPLRSGTDDEDGEDREL